MQTQQVLQILEIATELFFELGFWNAKVSDIATRSEISTASIYKEFKSKDALFRAVLVRCIDQFKANAKPVACDDDPLTCLSHVAHRYQALCSSALFQDLIRVPIGFSEISPTLRKSMCRQIRQALEQLCMPALVTCASHGLLDPNRVKDAFHLLGAYIEHQTLWYGFLVKDETTNHSQMQKIANEGVRIILSAYPPTPDEAFEPLSTPAETSPAKPQKPRLIPKD